MLSQFSQVNISVRVLTGLMERFFVLPLAVPSFFSRYYFSENHRSTQLVFVSVSTNGKKP